MKEETYNQASAIKSEIYTKEAQLQRILDFNSKSSRASQSLSANVGCVNYPLIENNNALVDKVVSLIIKSTKKEIEILKKQFEDLK